ncbi:MAG: 2-C-methyl-D-erythritol 4-phosphate cytidylyltransferase [Proteobacteria bacterium]|nr:2-C-methyl-D-erythritol 4-phosphate cytidylyltransferase [Pseudomonadota bacterium]
MVVEPRLFLIIPAAGSGSRMRAAVPKVFLTVGTEKVIARTVRILHSSVQFASTIVLTAPEEQMSMRQALAEAQGRVEIVVGGQTRQESVRLGLAALTERCAPSPDDIVLIHDAARCFVTPEIVERCISAAIEHGAVTAALALVDSLLRSDTQGTAAAWVDRTGMWAVQTPQAFRYALLAEAHNRAAPGATDDASLVAALHPVTVVEGARENIKITIPSDYEFAKRYLLS